MGVTLGAESQKRDGKKALSRGVSTYFFGSNTSFNWPITEG
jgi:hypothetical protein